MPLAKRIIPTMLVRGRTLVKGARFNSWRSIGVALQAAKVHARRGVDELCILDIAATAENRGPDLDLVRELSEGCYIPITVGGGIKSLADIDALLRAGADKVCIGTCKHLIPAAAARFGKQAIVASLDWKGNGFPLEHAVINAEFLAAGGAGEILLQSVTLDGTMNGYDLDLIREVSAAVNVPVIASGGCSSYDNMLEAFKAGADACAAGALFAFTDSTPKEAAKYLKTKGLEMRCA
jgi:cyclase